MTSVFLSYARMDDESFVRRLYEDLIKRGFEVWFDREDMPGRGLTFLHEIREAISERDRLVLVAGPSAVTSDYVEAEWRHALEMGKPVNPILRLGDYDLLPPELKLLDTPDFRDDADYEERLETLVRQLSEPIPPMGKLVAVPSLPPHFLQRNDRLRALKHAVMADLVRPQIVTGTAARTALQGMGGIGKSVLAAALARDSEVRRAFPDGVLWAEVGPEPNIVRLQREIARALGDEGHFDTPSEGKGRLAGLLAHRAVLLLLDDVWEARHAEAFDALGARCRMVMTTRDASLITALGGTEHQVQLLTSAEARHLLAEWAEQPQDDLPEEALEILAECDGLPLALSLCGALAREGNRWSDVLEALEEADLEFLDHPHGSVLRTIKVSVDRLTEDETARFAELRAFPPDETVPEDAVVTLWTYSGCTSARHARRLLTSLASRALVQLDGVAPNRRVALHDLVRDYTARIAPPDEVLHSQVVAAYRAACEDDWATGPNDGYFFTHLRNHLVGAGEAEELAGIAMDLRWLDTKAEAGAVVDLPSDIDAARSALPVDDPRRRLLRLIAQAVRMDLQFIARHPSTVFQCLWNRCWWYDCDEAANHYDPPEGGWGPQGPPWQRDEPRLCTLLERWRHEKEESEPGFVWVRSLRPPPQAVGGGQIVCLSGHESAVYSVAVGPGMRQIISGSADCSVRVWDAQSGVELARLCGHEDGVTSVEAFADGRRIVSGSRDSTVRIWDIQRGAQLACLLGHTDAVENVAVLPDGSSVVSGGKDGIRVWEPDCGEELACLGEEHGWIRCLSVLPDSRHVVSGEWPHTIRMWDLREEREVMVLRLVSSPLYPLECLAVLADGRRIVSGAHDGIRLWDVESRSQIWGSRPVQVKSVAVSPDESRVFAGTEDGTILCWDVDSGIELTAIRGHQSQVAALALSSDGRWIVSGSWDRTVGVWDEQRASASATLHGHNDVIENMAFSPAGKWIVSGSWDHTLQLWDATSGVRLAHLRSHTDPITHIDISPEGGRFASGSYDGRVRIWEASSRTEVACLWGHDSCHAVAFSPDGRRIVSAGDREIRVWDARDGAELAVLFG